MVKYKIRKNFGQGIDAILEKWLLHLGNRMDDVLFQVNPCNFK